MRLYKYNKKNLSYEKVSPKYKLISLVSMSTMIIISFFLGTFFGVTTTINAGAHRAKNHIMLSKHDRSPEEEFAWKDSVFTQYAIRADIYLSRSVFKGTPIKGEMMALCARNAYDSTGILLPVELALSQAQHESGMGREGRSPKNNPFNIGENDSGTVRWFDSTFGGTQTYYYYMCRNYLNCRSIEELFGNFVNCSGNRYASNPDYEKIIRNQYYLTKRWIDNSLKKK